MRALGLSGPWEGVKSRPLKDEKGAVDQEGMQVLP